MPPTLSKVSSRAEPLHTSATGRFGEIESLHTILALWVLFAHCLGVSGYEPEELHGALREVRMAGYAVNAFVILAETDCLPRFSPGAFLLYHIEYFALGILSYGLFFHFPETVAKKHSLLSISLILAL